MERLFRLSKRIIFILIFQNGYHRFYRYCIILFYCATFLWQYTFHSYVFISLELFTVF